MDGYFQQPWKEEKKLAETLKCNIHTVVMKMGGKIKILEWKFICF
jgi:hypothetical protein